MHVLENRNVRVLKMQNITFEITINPYINAMITS